jgi:hypothetical protein
MSKTHSTPTTPVPTGPCDLTHLGGTYAQAAFEAMFPDHTPKTDTRTPTDLRR